MRVPRRSTGSCLPRSSHPGKPPSEPCIHPFPVPWGNTVTEPARMPSRILKPGKSTGWGPAVQGAAGTRPAPQGRPRQGRACAARPGAAQRGQRRAGSGAAGLGPALMAPPRPFKAPRGLAVLRRAEPSRGE